MPNDPQDRRTLGPVLTYEGRPLPRPGEEVFDQGLAFDVGTLLSRRQALRALGFGITAFGLAACSGGSGTAAPPITSTLLRRVLLGVLAARVGGRHGDP